MSQRRSIVLIGLLLTGTLLAPAQSPVNGPSQVAPADGAILDNGCRNQRDPIRWEFQWQPVAGARTYRLYIKHLGATKKLLDIQTSDTSYAHISNGGYIAPHNLEGWRWSVRALVEGKWSSWSTFNFSVEPLDTDCPLKIIK